MLEVLPVNASTAKYRKILGEAGDRTLVPYIAVLSKVGVTYSLKIVIEMKRYFNWFFSCSSLATIIITDHFYCLVGFVVFE